MSDPTPEHPAAAEPSEEQERAGRDLRIVEALIFAADHPIDVEALAAQLPDGADIERALADLGELYRHRGIQLVNVAGGWTFRTAPDLADHLTVHKTVQRKLSRAALETLAIIAYHQPVTRAEVEDIRGVGLSRGTLDLLLEADWIAPKGRRRSPGRPTTWVTTAAFLEHFGLASLDDLPGIEELKAAGLLGDAEVRLGERAVEREREEAAADDEENPVIARLPLGDDGPEEPTAWEGEPVDDEPEETSTVVPLTGKS